jgi:hypothetical protein
MYCICICLVYVRYMYTFTKTYTYTYTYSYMHAYGPEPELEPEPESDKMLEQSSNFPVPQPWEKQCESFTAESILPTLLISNNLSHYSPYCLKRRASDSPFLSQRAGLIQNGVFDFKGQ